MSNSIIKLKIYISSVDSMISHCARGAAFSFVINATNLKPVAYLVLWHGR